jgi:site-specific DNA-methyltransferase (cytosine-N4-specific)
MLTDSGDIVVDPFAGSCVTGEVAERLKRNWVCVDSVEGYLKGAKARFRGADPLFPGSASRVTKDLFYRAYHPAAGWNGGPDSPLSPDGGKTRPGAKKKPARKP